MLSGGGLMLLRKGSDGEVASSMFYVFNARRKTCQAGLKLDS